MNPITLLPSETVVRPDGNGGLALDCADGSTLNLTPGEAIDLASYVAMLSDEGALTDGTEEDL